MRLQINSSEVLLYHKIAVQKIPLSIPRFHIHFHVIRSPHMKGANSKILHLPERQEHG
jgi:hypothetical protein